MSNKAQANQVVTHKIQTGGEITVNLVLTIKVENNGGVSISAVDAQPAENKKIIKEIIEDKNTNWLIPDIQPEGIIQFGEIVR